MGLKRTLVAFAFALGACTWFDEDPFADREDAQAQRSDAELIELKLERFEACRDGLIPVMEESFRRYKRAVSRGRRAAPRDKHFGIDRHNFRACKVGLADGLLMEPPMPELEAAARAFVEIAKDYAERSRWEGRANTDEAKLADERLERDYERWVSAKETLDVLLDRARSKNGAQLLEALEAHAQPLEMHARAVHVEARPLVTCLLTEPVPVAEVCAPLMENFEQHYAQFEQSLGQSSSQNVFWIDTYAASAAAFDAEVADAMAALRARNLSDGDRVRLRRTHRDLVRDAKTLSFRFP